MEVLSKHCKRTSAVAFKLVEPKEIKMYLIFRIKSSPTSIRKQNIRQSTVYGYYKTLQMVYCLDARQQPEKPINDMIRLGSPVSKNLDIVTPSPLSDFTPLLSSPRIRTSVSICMLTGS